MSKVIKVENLSKQYRLGQIGTGTIRHDINRWWHKIRGNEDPYLKIGDENNRTQKGDSDYVWALQNINFDVKQGEVLGIIGRNGAGKSTLLKILARTTAPTIGEVKVKGRIASLLEVGTGFHPELSGRDNIFLNGAILGMTKSEIKSKFDEIVDFAGVERYIDTPVKRYSSGMYVRLAFGVAAHLEPDILIVDEVLAVGDAEFQKKALGKMKDVSNKDGRTVLFVSHNMTAVKGLCTSAISMEYGKIKNHGDVLSIVSDYENTNYSGLVSHLQYENMEDAVGNDEIKIKRIEIIHATRLIEEDIFVEFELWNLTKENRITIGFDLVSSTEVTVFSTGAVINTDDCNVSKGRCTIPGNFLNDGIYYINLFVFTEGMRDLYRVKEIVSFEVLDKERDYAFYGKINGIVRPKLNWE